MNAEAHSDLDLDLEENPFSAKRAAEPAPAATASPVAEAAERLKRAAGSNVRRLREAAEAGFETYRSSAVEGGQTAPAKPAPNWDELREKAKELHREGEAWARENPTAAVAIAAGAGLFLGLLLKRSPVNTYGCPVGAAPPRVSGRSWKRRALRR